jgi:hypothetical protein
MKRKNLAGDYSQYGGEIGGMIGSIIPGLGTAIGTAVGSIVGGLLGPSAHYTPSGMLYDTASEGLKSNAVELADLMNELYERIGSPTRVPVPQFTMTSADDPKVGPYLAKLLNNPAFNSYTTPEQLGTLLQDGVYDGALQVQQSMIDAIEQALDGLQDGTLVVSAGRVVPAGSAIASCANSSVAQNCGYSGNCGTSGEGTCTSTAGFLANNSGYVLAGLGVLGLVVLLAKRR